MKTYLPVIIAVALILGTAIIQGTMTERWQEFPELELYAAQLKNVPMQIGEWTGEDAPPTEQRILDMAGAVGSLSRVYHSGKGERVSIFIVCGRFVDVFLHTPERCYPSAGFEMTGEKINKVVDTGDGPAQFITTTFLKAVQGGSQNLRIYWSWRGNTPWLAPMDSSYKWKFAGQRALYKLYVITPNSNGTSRGETNPDQNAAVDFIRVFIPELDRAVAPAFVNDKPGTETPIKSEAADKI